MLPLGKTQRGFARQQSGYTGLGRQWIERHEKSTARSSTTTCPIQGRAPGAAQFVGGNFLVTFRTVWASLSECDLHPCWRHAPVQAMPKMFFSAVTIFNEPEGTRRRPLPWDDVSCRGSTMSLTCVKLTTPGRAAGTAGNPKSRAARVVRELPAERPSAVHFACRSPVSRPFAHAVTMARRRRHVLSLMAEDSA